MNEAHEVEFTEMKTSFFASPVNIVLGVERLSSLKVDAVEGCQGFTDDEWQVIYARVLLEDRWYFLPPDLYDEIDEQHSDLIGDRLWQLSQSLN